MDKDSKFTRDKNGFIAVRVVSGTEVLPAEDKDYMFARDTNGNIAVRVVGGDSHNKGFFATVEALEEAYPTAEAGDFAVVGTTDTVWIWDAESGTSGAWVDSDTKGQVTSVNSQTGAVVLSASDVGAATSEQGAKADTAIQSVKTINNQSIVGEGNLNIDALPSQSGQSGKFLTTDGTNASWGAVDALPSQTGMNGKFLQTNGTTASWETAAQVAQPSTMPTLAVADWSLNAQTNKYEQTVNVTGVTASNAVLVAPFPVNATEYAQCNVIAVAQGAGTLSFQADSLPANALGVNVVTLS